MNAKTPRRQEEKKIKNKGKGPPALFDLPLSSWRLGVLAFIFLLAAQTARAAAAGGIRDLAAARAMLDAGADRLGMSATVEVLEELKRT